MTTQGFRCAATDCPILADPGRGRCPERSQLCEYVRCSIEVAQGGTYPDPSDRPGASPVAPMSFNTPDHMLDRNALRRRIDNFASEMRDKGIHIGINGRCVCGVKWPCESSIEATPRSRS